MGAFFWFLFSVNRIEESSSVLLFSAPTDALRYQERCTQELRTHLPPAGGRGLGRRRIRASGTYASLRVRCYDAAARAAYPSSTIRAARTARTSGPCARIRHRPFRFFPPSGQLR